MLEERLTFQLLSSGVSSTKIEVNNSVIFDRSLILFPSSAYLWSVTSLEELTPESLSILSVLLPPIGRLFFFNSSAFLLRTSRSLSVCADRCVACRIRRRHLPTARVRQSVRAAPLHRLPISITTAHH